MQFNMHPHKRVPHAVQHVAACAAGEPTVEDCSREGGTEDGTDPNRTDGDRVEAGCCDQQTSL
jgi:hypothetical protein